MEPEESIYRDHSSRLDTVGSFNQGTIAFWAAVRLASRDYMLSNLDQPNAFNKWTQFGEWFLENYGVKLHLTDGGFYNQDIDIVDQDKYLMFVLKYIR